MAFGHRLSSKFNVILTASVAASALSAGIAQARDYPGGAAGPDVIVTNSAQGGTTNTPSIVISEPGTPTTAIDTEGGVNGVGQMVIDQKNGYVGLCTGTLINPRTVIFAAHCVNENLAGDDYQDPWGYGTGANQRPVSFGFQVSNNLARAKWMFGNITGIDKDGYYIFGGENKYKSRPEDYIYNVNQVLYNSISTEIGFDRNPDGSLVTNKDGSHNANNFLQGDIALASLDTPAKNIPTWTLLLSALPAPDAISDTTGTGYHVISTGYGRNGTGTEGSVNAVDYRRRIVENFIGLLGSLNDNDLFLYGESGKLPQNLYQIDFDDPKRGTPDANTRDFNLFKDDALPKEGITASGDSGGPLILDDTYAEQVVIGVLSGGSTYYRNQPSASYGTSSFYQPLYLYWDYIVANNPYRYVGTKAGDGKWSDPTHWQTLMDPAYRVLVDNTLTTGLPTDPGLQTAVDPHKFGTLCFRTDCINVNDLDQSDNEEEGESSATGGGGTTSNSMGKAVASDLSSASDPDQGGDGNGDGTGTTTAAAILPAPTLANGLPGASDFVPDNIDPDAATRRNARYFDVTLSEAGTTTLDTAATVDNFTVAGSDAKLIVTSEGSLTSLMQINQLTGLVQVDGTIATLGDYFLMGGGLAGNGRINAPFFTNATGMIAPGGIGTIGTLTFAGNVILSSGSQLLIDLGPNQTADKIAVVKSAAGDDGIASIGGQAGFAPVSGHVIRSGDVYTILTAEGGVDGTFSGSPLSAILTPRFIYGPNSVEVSIDAGRYADVVSRGSRVQTSYAQLLDQNRADNYASLSALYGPLDLQNQATIRGALDGLAPRTETERTALGTVAIDNIANLVANRLNQLDASDMGGTVAVIGRPMTVAALASVGATGASGIQADATETSVTPARLPENLSAFIAGGYLTGDSRSMPGAFPLSGRDDFDGYFLAAGIEAYTDDGSTIGFALSYTDVKGTTRGGSAKGKLYQGTLYGKADMGDDVRLDAQLGAGLYETTTLRQAPLLGSDYRLRGKDSSLAVTGEVGASTLLTSGSLSLIPRVAFRASSIDFSTIAETGGPTALKIDRNRLNSAQGRAGLTLKGEGQFRPFVSGYYVHEFLDPTPVFGANFVGGIGPDAPFALAGRDRDWAEVNGGLAITAGPIELSASASTTIKRDDLSYQSYRGTVRFRF